MAVQKAASPVDNGWDNSSKLVLQSELSSCKLDGVGLRAIFIWEDVACSSVGWRGSSIFGQNWGYVTWRVIPSSKKVGGQTKQSFLGSYSPCSSRIYWRQERKAQVEEEEWDGQQKECTWTASTSTETNQSKVFKEERDSQQKEST